MLDRTYPLEFSKRMSKKVKLLFLSLICAALCLAFSACASDSESEKEEAQDLDDNILGISYTGETKVSYCNIAYMDEDTTRSIYEIFTGEEFSQGYLTLRSQPNERAGMYFYIMISGPDSIPLASTIELSVDKIAEGAKATTYTFTVPETHSLLREIRLGLTGKDWQDPKTKVNAFRIVIKNPGGKVVLDHKSWLWSMPKDSKPNE